LSFAEEFSPLVSRLLYAAPQQELEVSLRWIGLYMLIAGLLVIAIVAGAPTANWTLFYCAAGLASAGVVLFVVDAVRRWHPWRRRGMR
jgi:hypothetical protein